MKELAFIAGAARSGTTAMVELLNTHEDICIGVERYKYKWKSRKEFAGDEFEFQRFFDFKETDTNIRPESWVKYSALYEDMKEKYLKSKVVGDKIPHLEDQFKELSSTFGRIKFMYMLREPMGLAASWQVRAANPDDRAWPVTNGFKRAIERWNASMKWAGRIPADQILIVPFESLFSDKTQSRIFSFLNVNQSEAVARKARNSSRTDKELARKRLILNENEQAYVRANADMATYEALKARS